MIRLRTAQASTHFGSLSIAWCAYDAAVVSCPARRCNSAARSRISVSFGDFLHRFDDLLERLRGLAALAEHVGIMTMGGRIVGTSANGLSQQSVRLVEVVALQLVHALLRELPTSDELLAHRIRLSPQTTTSAGADDDRRPQRPDEDGGTRSRRR